MNFSNFSMALIILLRCSTGEGWNLIMRELAIQEDQPVFWKNGRPTEDPLYCKRDQTFDDLKEFGPQGCGGKDSYMYFVIFIVVIQMMMLNLFIAVVLEGFSSTNKEHTGVVTS